MDNIFAAFSQASPQDSNVNAIVGDVRTLTISNTVTTANAEHYNPPGSFPTSPIIAATGDDQEQASASTHDNIIGGILAYRRALADWHDLYRQATGGLPLERQVSAVSGDISSLDLGEPAFPLSQYSIPSVEEDDYFGPFATGDATFDDEETFWSASPLSRPGRPSTPFNHDRISLYATDSEDELRESSSRDGPQDRATLSTNPWQGDEQAPHSGPAFVESSTLGDLTFEQVRGGSTMDGYQSATETDEQPATQNTDEIHISSDSENLWADATNEDSTTRRSSNPTIPSPSRSPIDGQENNPCVRPGEDYHVTARQPTFVPPYDRDQDQDLAHYPTPSTSPRVSPRDSTVSASSDIDAFTSARILSRGQTQLAMNREFEATGVGMPEITRMRGGATFGVESGSRQQAAREGRAHRWTFKRRVWRM
ncbi:hypothetical protein LTR62_008138 [Meristemomyces frigidus]|uniref:Uncharacterized protein n=1 Tax=Meristemomyces frigidus TaxID=1508187 RepID=A0AAN7TB32_9PEZI|nr:hypothetical protein LTR62_008138 [Meristemomyces frigidus]